MSNIPIKFQRMGRYADKAVIPEYKTIGAACFDLVAAGVKWDNENKLLVVYVGFGVEIPEGYKMTIVPRSSFTGSEFILQNSPCQIDSDYRGEIGIKFRPIDPFALKIPFEDGERFAQGMIEKVIKAKFEEVDELAPTERGAGGYGSTGKI